MSEDTVQPEQETHRQVMARKIKQAMEQVEEAIVDVLEQVRNETSGSQ